MIDTAAWSTRPPATCGVRVQPCRLSPSSRPWLAGSSSSAPGGAKPDPARPVYGQLKQRGLELPNPFDRISVLEGVFDAWANGDLKRVSDIEPIAANALQEQKLTARLRWPLAVSLTLGGPIPVVESDELRDAEIRELPSMSRKSFVIQAHASWLAQALIRLAPTTVTDEEAELELLGADPPPDYIEAFERAKGRRDQYVEERGSADNE